MKAASSARTDSGRHFGNLTDDADADADAR
jgi:hypothetical protein